MKRLSTNGADRPGGLSPRVRGVGLWPVVRKEPADCSARLWLRPLRVFDRQTWRFVATRPAQPRAASHADPRPHNPCRGLLPEPGVATAQRRLPQVTVPHARLNSEGVVCAILLLDRYNTGYRAPNGATVGHGRNAMSARIVELLRSSCARMIPRRGWPTPSDLADARAEFTVQAELSRVEQVPRDGVVWISIPTQCPLPNPATPRHNRRQQGRRGEPRVDRRDHPRARFALRRVI